VKLYAALLKTGAEPVLVREGFAWGAFFFGPLWFAAHRAWVAAAFSLAATVLVVALLPQSLSVLAVFALAILFGLLAQDLRCNAMERRGYLTTHVVAARGHDEALMRLLTFRPELVQGLARKVL
jgi:Protein of unknown function (DUF2628)